MKKFFSFLTAILFAGSLMASEVTFTKADFAGQGTANTGSEVTATKSGVTFTYSKGYCADESLRCYAHGALSITAESTIEKINFTTTGGKTGGLNAEVEVDDTEYAVADLASQARFTEIKVTLAESGSTLYLTLSSDWAGWTEKYSVYYFDDTKNGWSNFMTEVEGEENMWTTTIPVGYSKIIFVRNNSGAAAPGWDSGDYSIVWSKTVDLTIPEGKNHFTVTSGGTGSECNGTWSTYTPGVAPEPVDSMTVYFYNNLDWATVNTFVWPAEGNAYKTWPGEAAKKETEQIHGKDVYAYTFPASYVNVIFNNGTKQTTDQVWVEAKPYFVPGAANGEGKFDGTWCAKEDIPVPEVPAKFYITGDTALVVDGGADKMMAWKPNAIKSETDTFTLNLKADVDYILKVTLNGTWEGENNIKGFNELSEKTPGLLDISNDHNIGFRLNEAGEVKVVYIPAANEEPEVFKLIGDFYVKPIVKKELKLVPGEVWNVDGAQFAAYLWGDNDYQAEWTPFFAGEGDTLSVEINAEADSMVLVRFSDKVAAPTWENEETNIWGKIDKIEIDYTSLVYTVTSYTTGTWEVYEPVIIDLEDGFYLVGTFNGVDAWSLEDLSAEKLFKVTDQEGQYSIDVTLLAGDEFKAIEVKDNALIEWYPKEGGNYVVDDAHAGKKTIYFRPEFWADWNGHFYVAPNPGESINNVEAVKAVKVLRDGQIMIIKGNKTYNVLGAEIR